MRKKLVKVFLETLPILTGVLLSYLFWQNNLVLFAIYLTLSLGLIFWHKDRTEFVIFGYGLIVGLVVEIIGTKISGYQSFTKPDFGGIPLWLPVAWGYGFVAIKRVGLAFKE